MSNLEALVRLLAAAVGHQELQEFIGVIIEILVADAGGGERGEL